MRRSSLSPGIAAYLFADGYFYGGHTIPDGADPPVETCAGSGQRFFFGGERKKISIPRLGRPMADVVHMQVVCVALCIKGSPRISRLIGELKRVDLFNITYLRHSERDHDDGVRGCFEAHQRALQFILDQTGCTEDTIIFVMEDDVSFEVDEGSTVFDAIVTAGLGLRDRVADVIAVGAVPITPMFKVSGHAMHTCVWQMSHAYVVTPQTARTIVSWTFVRHNRILRLLDHYDQKMSMSLKQALVYPTIAFQDATSDLTTTNTQWYYVLLMTLRDWIRQRNLQRMSEALFMAVGKLLELAGYMR